MLAVFKTGRIPHKIVPVFFRHFIPQFHGFIEGNVANTVPFPDTVTIITLGADIFLQFIQLFGSILQSADAVIVLIGVCLAVELGIAQTDQRGSINCCIHQQLEGLCKVLQSRYGDIRRKTDQLGKHMGDFYTGLFIILITKSFQIAHCSENTHLDVTQVAEVQRAFVDVIGLGILEVFIQLSV